ncbi:MAG: hypothetical protein U1F68_08330 [Gammaproteobacteria bacterium]
MNGNDIRLGVARRPYMIHNGTVRLEGTRTSLVRNPEVVHAYWGGAAQYG